MQGSRQNDGEARDGSTVRNIVISSVIAINLMGVNLGYNQETAEGGYPLLVGVISFALTLLIVVLLGKDLLIAALSALKKRVVVVELPFISGVIAALVISVINLYRGGGPIYFETVGLLLVVYTIGKWIGARVRIHAIDESKQVLAGFLPEYELILNGVSEKFVRPQDIRTGETIVVKAGAVIPVDGVIRKGLSHVGETMFTGEPFPDVLGPGSSVYAGTKAYDGELWVEATQTGVETRLHSIIESVESAMRLPSVWVKQVDRFVSWFFPVVFAVFLGTFFFWGFKSGVDVGLMHALAVLLIACPCAMGLATPVALWAGMGAMARLGVRVHDPEAFERVSGVDYAVFDKTGTLTQVDVESSHVSFVGGEDGVDDGDRARIFGMAALLQTATDHPYAAVFLHSASGVVPGARLEAFRALPGIGISGEFFCSGDTVELAIGNEYLLSSDLDRKIAKELVERLTARHLDVSSVNVRILYLRLDGKIVGAVLLKERLIDDVGALFHALGVPIGVLTGDPSEKTHQLFGGRKELVQFIGVGVSPQEKADRILQLQRDGYRVLYVGDGMNDAPAMASASVSVAIGGYQGLQARASSFSVAGTDIHRVSRILSFSRDVKNTIHANVAWAAAYNVVGMGVAVAGLLEPVFAALLMTGSSLFVSWRAHCLRMRLVDASSIA